MGQRKIVAPEKACKINHYLVLAINAYNGKLTIETMANLFGLEYTSYEKCI